MLRHLIAAFFKRLILPSGIRVPERSCQIKSNLFPGFKQDIDIPLPGCEKQLHYGLVRLCDMKDFGTVAVDICAAAADKAVKTHITETLFHILKTAPGIDEHQIPVCPRRPYSIDGTFRNRTVNLGSQCSIDIKKSNFLHE